MIPALTTRLAALRDALVLLALGAVIYRTWLALAPGWFWVVCLAALAFMAGLIRQNGIAAMRRTWDQARHQPLLATAYLGARLGLTLIFAAITLGALWLYPRVSPAGLWIAYFNGTAFEQEVCRRTLRELVCDYEQRAPALGVHANNFSARGDGILRVPLTADYAFYSQSDDGLRLIIDGNTVIDSWRDQSWNASGTAGHLNLTAGHHRLRVEYYNRSGDGAWRIKWAGGPIPANTVMATPYLRKRL